MTGLRAPIVVGIDGTETGLGAARYAAIDARDHGRPIMLVHAYHVAAALNPLLPWYGLQSQREVGIDLLDEAERAVLEIAPLAKVRKRIFPTTGASAIASETEDAAYVAIGRRHTSRIMALLAGSTTVGTASRAHCPVISVPDTWETSVYRHRVVVGIDGTTGAEDALAFAFAATSERGGTLWVVRAWEPGVRGDEPHRIEDDVATWAELAQVSLSEQLAGWEDTYPDVTVVRVFERAPSAAAGLLHRAEGAGLLVIGGRGVAVPGFEMGATAREVLEKAECPVAIVHRGQAGRFVPLANVSAKAVSVD